MTRNLELTQEQPHPRTAPRASALWLAARGLRAPADESWKLTIALDVVDPRLAGSNPAAGTRLHIMIDSFEWSVFFCHGSGSSWVRVVDVPRVHERDDFELLPHMTDLRGLGHFVQWLERRVGLRFRRQHAAIYTNLADAHQKILLWVIAAL